MIRINKNAFTLIELLAVVVIIAVIATIGLFSITMIMQKVRKDTIKDTAVAAKKAAINYLASNPIESGVIEIDMTPNRGEYAEFLDVIKDPWGDPYANVKALVYKEANHDYKIDLYLGSKNGCFYLANNSDELVEDEVCGETTPTKPIPTLNSNYTYTINWNNGIAPFKLYANNNLLTTTNNRSYTYAPAPGIYDYYVESATTQKSSVNSYFTPKQLGGPNTAYQSPTGLGWSISKDTTRGVVATVQNVDDSILNKSVVEYEMTTMPVGAWGAYARFNIYLKYAPAPFFIKDKTYKVKWKARLYNPPNNKSFAFSIKDGNGQNIVWAGGNYLVTSSWQDYEYTFTAGQEGTWPIFFISFLNTGYKLRISDLEIYNTTP